MEKQGDFRGRRARGARGEALAARHLEERGYSIIARNVRYRCGEIDLVARKGRELHFVEVKTRADARYSEPIEAVTPRKQQRLRRAAQCYLAELADRTGREPGAHFVVVGIDLSTEPPRIDLVLDAFE